MNMNMKKILLVYGSGGHNEQMRRFYNSILDIDKQKEIDYVSLCDDDVKNILTKKTYIVTTVTDKFSYTRLLFKLPIKLLDILKVLNTIKEENNITHIISTGPGISIIASLYFKTFTKVKIIHIETWSRFYSKSLTGRFMYYIADIFFVQNQELLNIYPKANYKGRL